MRWTHLTADGSEKIYKTAVLTPPGYGTTLPTSPVDGQEYVLVDSVTNPTYQWRFRYNASSTSPYKWEFVGGPPMRHEIDALETTASTSYVDLATPGPLLTVPRAGDYLLEYGACLYLSASVANGQISMSPSFAGSTPTAVDAVQIYAPNALSQSSVARKRIKTGLAASSVVKLQYVVGGGTQSVLNRWLNITPIRVS